MICVAGGKVVTDLQKELQDLLFGEEVSKHESVENDYLDNPVEKINNNNTNTNVNYAEKVKFLVVCFVQ